MTFSNLSKNIVNLSYFIEFFRNARPLRSSPVRQIPCFQFSVRIKRLPKIFSPRRLALLKGLLENSAEAVERVPVNAGKCPVEAAREAASRRGCATKTRESKRSAGTGRIACPSERGRPQGGGQPWGQGQPKRVVPTSRPCSSRRPQS